MKKILLIIVTFFILSYSQAQISGYMGKKFSIILNTGISFPHLRGLYDGNKLAALPSFNNAISLDYVFSRTNSFGFRYKLAINSGLNPDNLKDQIFFRKRHKFFGHTMGVYIKMYSSRTIAPLGFYTKLGINFQYLVLEDRINESSYGNRAIKKDYFQYDVVANFAIGRNWLMFDNLILGFELEGGLPIASFFRAFGTLGNNYEDITKDGSPISSRINTSSELLKLSLNIGFLAF